MAIESQYICVYYKIIFDNLKRENMKIKR